MQKLRLTPTKHHAIGTGIETAWQEFLDSMPRRKFTRATINHYAATKAHFMTWLTANYPEATGLSDLADSKFKIVVRYYDHLSATYESARTVYGYLSDIRAWFSWLIEQEEIETTPFPRIIKMPEIPKPTPDHFNDEEWAALMKATEGKDHKSIRNRALIGFLIDTGARLDETSKIKIGAIDLSNGRVDIINGKGQKDRATWISSVTCKEIRAYLDFHPEARNPDAPLWIGERGPMTRNGVSITIQKLGSKAKYTRNGCKVSVHASPHKFRRTCALNMLKNGANLLQVQATLGHEDLSVLKHYVKYLSSDTQDAHKQFGARSFFDKKKMA